MNENDNLIADFEELALPNQTWSIDFERNLVGSNITDLAAIQQSAKIILSVERFEHLIYSDQYGVELRDLFGESMPYAMSEIKRRVSEALMQDDRILGTENFEFSRTKRSLHVTFTVKTDLGSFDAETEVAL
jgi:phage baseplate assembly protein W